MRSSVLNPWNLAGIVDYKNETETYSYLTQYYRKYV
jgi:hypothetical protein